MVLKLLSDVLRRTDDEVNTDASVGADAKVVLPIVGGLAAGAYFARKNKQAKAADDGDE